VEDVRDVVSFQDLVHAAPLAVMVHVAGTVIYANRCAEDVMGVAPGSGPGLRLMDVVHPESAEQVHRRIGELLDGHGLPGSSEWAIVRPDGALVRVESVESTVAVGDAVGVCVMACDVTERTRREAHLAHLATHDGLTGLPNRLLLLDRLAQALTHIGRGCVSVLVLFVDLNAFKAVNDAHGHAAGDQVLREAGRRLAEVVRAGDTVARLAGDEFVVCAEINEPGADEALARRVRQALDRPYAINASPVHVGASVGALLLDRSTDPVAALADADRLMYAAKRGRTRRPTQQPSPITAQSAGPTTRPGAPARR
jgi:diguanylate cyclase (GGDEF)-like protein/PAS domain S-box-containing protein